MIYVMLIWVCRHCGNVGVQYRSLSGLEQVFPAPQCQCGHRYTFQGLEVVSANR